MSEAGRDFLVVWVSLVALAMLVVFGPVVIGQIVDVPAVVGVAAQMVAFGAQLVGVQ